MPPRRVNANILRLQPEKKVIAIGIITGSIDKALGLSAWESRVVYMRVKQLSAVIVAKRFVFVTTSSILSIQNIKCLSKYYCNTESTNENEAQ